MADEEEQLLWDDDDEEHQQQLQQQGGAEENGHGDNAANGTAPSGKEQHAQGSGQQPVVTEAGKGHAQESNSHAPNSTENAHETGQQPPQQQQQQNQQQQQQQNQQQPQQQPQPQGRQRKPIPIPAPKFSSSTVEPEKAMPHVSTKFGPKQQNQQIQQQQRQRPRRVRYFIIRSYNQENVDISINVGGWATTKHNEIKLNEAYATCDEVRLVFSVNGSNCFQGYAVMCTPVGQYRSIIWSNGKAFGNAFGVEWRCVFNLEVWPAERQQASARGA